MTMKEQRAGAKSSMSARKGPCGGDLTAVKVGGMQFSWMVSVFTGQEGGLEAFLSFGFVMECGRSSTSPNWHSVLIYGSKKTH